MASIGQARSVSAPHGARYETYAEKKEEAKEVYRKNLDGTSRREINAEFKERRELHERSIKNPDIVLEFAPDLNSYRNQSGEPDWHALSEELLQRFAKELHTHTGKPVDWRDLQGRFIYHSKMNVREIPHLHGRFNRILSNGEVIADRHIGMKFKKACEEMDKAHGYKTAKELGKDMRADVKKKAHDALKAYANTVTRKDRFSLDQYMVLCKTYGLNLIKSISSTGRLSGYKLQLDDSYDGDYHHEYKVSDIDRELTMKRIDDTFSRYVRLCEKERKEEEDRQARLQAKKDKDNEIKQQEEKKNEPKQDNKPRWHFRR